MLPFVRLKERSLTVHTSPSSLLKADDYLAYASAETLEKAAEAMQEAMLAKAQRHYDAEKKRGYQDGQEEAQRENIERLCLMVDKAIDYITHLETAMTQLINDALRKIIDTYDNDELTVAVVRDGLQAVCNQAQIKIIVAPEQVPVLKKQMATWLDTYPTVEFIEVVADAAMKVGDCRLETPVGIVDASVDVQLAALSEAFEKRIKRQNRGNKAKNVLTKTDR